MHPSQRITHSEDPESGYPSHVQPNQNLMRTVRRAAYDIKGRLVPEEEKGKEEEAMPPYHRQRGEKEEPPTSVKRRGLGFSEGEDSGYQEDIERGEPRPHPPRYERKPEPVSEIGSPPSRNIPVPPPRPPVQGTSPYISWRRKPTTEGWGLKKETKGIGGEHGGGAGEGQRMRRTRPLAPYYMGSHVEHYGGGKRRGEEEGGIMERDWVPCQGGAFDQEYVVTGIGKGKADWKEMLAMSSGGERRGTGTRSRRGKMEESQQLQQPGGRWDREKESPQIQQQRPSYQQQRRQREQPSSSSFPSRQSPMQSSRPSRGLGHLKEDLLKEVQDQALQFRLRPTMEIKYGYGQRVYQRRPRGQMIQEERPSSEEQGISSPPREDTDLRYARELEAEERERRMHRAREQSEQQEMGETQRKKKQWLADIPTAANQFAQRHQYHQTWRTQTH